MVLVVTHDFVNLKADGPDPTLVKPSDWNAPHTITGTGQFEAGIMVDFVGHTVPDGFVEAYGQSLDSGDNATLYAAMVKTDTVTLPLAVPGVVNWTDHGLSVGSKVRFQTDDTLPTGVVANTDYYIISAGFGASAFQIASSPGGSAISFTGVTAGNHTGIHAQFGVANDLSSFTVPDARGRVTAGFELMGGGLTSGRLTGQSGGVSGSVVGAAGGAEEHSLVLAENGPHTHSANPPSTSTSSDGSHTHANTLGVTGSNVAAGGHTHANTLGVTGTVASDGAHTHANTLGVTGTVASDGAHTHADTFAISGSIDVSGAHSHNDNIAVTIQNDTHSHVLSGYEEWVSAEGGGTHRVYQPTAEGGGTSPDVISVGNDTHNHTATVTGGVLSTGSTHTHTDTFDISGSVSSGGSHTHGWSGSVTGSITSGGAHTHGWSGSITGAITAAVDHTHTWSGSITGSITSGGTHTHTVDIAAFDTASSGSGDGHNNVQPTLVVRKLVFAG